MRRASLALVLGSVFAVSAFAEDPHLPPTPDESKPHSLSLTTTLASDYMADGVSASDSKPALQLGLDYEHESGFYAGIWASNVDSDDEDTPNLELDYTIGFKHALIGDTLEGDIGITHYSYYHVSDHDEADYQEWFAGLTLLENTSLYYYYADDSKVWDGVQRRIIAEHVQPLPEDFSLILTAEHVGLESGIGDDYERRDAQLV